MDSVFIRDISLFGRHGVHDEERSRAQEFIIDIVAEFDAQKAAESDVLADTIDYTDFLAAAKDAVENKSFNLIERLADCIATQILHDQRISQVWVTVRKPAALSNGKPGISIVRSREHVST